MLRVLPILLALPVLPLRLPAQGQALSGDIAQAVTTALRQARHDIIGPRKHLSVDLVQSQPSRTWRPSQLAAFRAILAAGDTARAGVEICDSRQRPCRLDDSSEVVSVFEPRMQGDTLIVLVQRTLLRSNVPPRIRFSLIGREYRFLRRGARWVVVRADNTLVT